MYKPTDRERQRYVQYTGPSPVPTFTKLFGCFGHGRAGLQERSNGVIRATATGVDMVKAAICLTPGCHTTKVTSNITKARLREEK